MAMSLAVFGAAVAAGPQGASSAFGEGGPDSRIREERSGAGAFARPDSAWCGVETVSGPVGDPPPRTREGLSRVLGRPLSPAAVDEDGFTDLHYAALLNLPEAVRELMAAGAVVEPWVAVVDRMFGVSDGVYMPDGTKYPVLVTEAEFRDPLAHGFRDTFYLSELTEAEKQDLFRSQRLSDPDVMLDLDVTLEDLHDLSGPVRRRLCQLVGYDVAGWLRLDDTPVEFAVVGNAVEALSVLARGRGGSFFDLIREGEVGKLLNLATLVDAREAAAWLLQDVDVNLREVYEVGSERTPLHHAAGNGDAGMVEALAARGMDVNERDGRGRTPMHYAAWNDREEAVKVLAAASADPRAVRDDGSTPLHDAAWRDARAAVEALVDLGVPVDIAAVPSIASWKSAEDGAQSTEATADPGAWTPLYRAAWNDARDAAEALLAHGADVNARDAEGWTPLHAAAAGNAEATARLLLERGADMEARDHSGWTALHHAVWHEARPVATLLASRGARLDGKPGSGETPLADAGWWARAVRTVEGLEYYDDVFYGKGEPRKPRVVDPLPGKGKLRRYRVVDPIWSRIRLNQYVDSIAGVCSLDRPVGERADRVKMLLENLRKFTELELGLPPRAYPDTDYARTQRLRLGDIMGVVLEGSFAESLNRSYLDHGSGSNGYEELSAGFDRSYRVAFALGRDIPPSVACGPYSYPTEWAEKLYEGLRCLHAAPRGWRCRVGPEWSEFADTRGE